MKTTFDLGTIYPEADETILLPDPISGFHYRMLSSGQLIELANRALDIILEIGYEQILVAEAGAVCFAKICAYLSRQRGLSLLWYSIKIPREMKDCLSICLGTYLYLSQSDLLLSSQWNQALDGFMNTKTFKIKDLAADYFELPSQGLKGILSTIQEPLLPCKDLAGKSCGLALILEKPFVYFDEYLDSGKTVFQTFRFLKLFAQEPKFKIFAYLIKLAQSDIDPNVCKSLYNLDNEQQAYRSGVYPFENRLDWLGYFYWIQPKKYCKIAIADLGSNYFDSDLDSEILADFINSLSQQPFLKDLKQLTTIEVLRDFISIPDLIRYSLYEIEILHFGRSMISEFLYQLFDMYGPIWSPLPDSYHLDYLCAFDKAKASIQKLLRPKIRLLYLELRSKLIHALVRLIETRRKTKQQSLLNQLEKNYENKLRAVY